MEIRFISETDKIEGKDGELKTTFEMVISRSPEDINCVRYVTKDVLYGVDRSMIDINYNDIPKMIKVLEMLLEIEKERKEAV